MWFAIYESLQGKLILLCLFIIVAAIFQSNEVNKLINRLNEENKHNYRKPVYMTASYYSLILAVVLLILVLILPFTPSVE